MDGRTDQYSLACVLYEMLAGEPPYTGPTAQAIIAKRLSEPVPHLGTLREVPAGVEAAVTRALAKAPADRFPNAGDFAVALDRPATRRRLGPTRHVILSRRDWAALLLGLLAWILRRPSAGGPMVTRQLTFTGDGCCPALSPDGNWAAFARNDSLMVQEMSGSRPLFIAQAELIGDRPRWSPDGTRILYTARDSQDIWLYTVPRSGETPTGSPRRASPGSTTVPTGARSCSAGVSPTRFSLRMSAPARSSVACRSRRDPTWRGEPDTHRTGAGSPLAARRRDPFLAVVSPDGSTMRRLVDWVDRGTVEWSPRGDALYFFQRVPGGADLMKVRIDPETGERRGRRSG